MVKRVFALAALLTLAGCASTGQYDPNVAGHIAADFRCVAQLAIDGITVAGNPAVGGVKTAADVVGAIQAVQSVTPDAYNACTQTLEYVGYDISALKAKVKK